MNRQAKELVELATQLGFCFVGYDGNDHVRLVHANGGTVTIPSTPSEYRGRANAIAMLERVSGQKLPRPKHRKSHKACKPSGFSIERARADAAAYRETAGATVEDLEGRRSALIEHCHDLAQDRGTIHDIPPVLDRIAALEAELRALHRVVEPFDPFTLRH